MFLDNELKLSPKEDQSGMRNDVLHPECGFDCWVRTADSGITHSYWPVSCGWF